MIYLVILVVFVFFALLEQVRGTGTFIPILKYASLIFLVIFIGFRYRTGPDYESYELIYQDKSSPVLEYLFQLLISIAKSIKLNYNYFLLLIAALSLSIKWISLNKYSPYFFFSIVIAFQSYILADMGQIRFSLAIAVSWLSLHFCLERKLIPFLLIVFIASLFHRSAVILLPLYWFGYFNINFWIMLGSWGACYILSFALANLGFFEELSEFFVSETMADKIDLYADNEEFGTRYDISLWGILSKVIVLGLIFYSSIPDDKMKRIFTNIYFVGGCAFFLFSFNEIFGSRISLYFFSFEPIMVPIAIYFIKDIKLHYMLLSFFILKSMYQLIVQVYMVYPDLYLPYKNFLFR